MDFRLRDFFYPLAVYRMNRFLKRAERFSREQLEDYQNERLRLLIDHAYRNVPYYTRLFDKNGILPHDIRTTADLPRIPVLTKDLVRQHFAELVSGDHRSRGSQLLRTSGSTGTPLEFYVDRTSRIARVAFFWRVWRAAGYRPCCRWVRFCGVVLPPKQMWTYSRVLSALHIPSFAITRDNVEVVIRKLERFPPSIVRGYPSALHWFATLVHDHARLRKLHVKSIVTDSETLLPRYRQHLEDAFGCPVYDTYHQWESVCLIADCENGSKHHQMEYGVMELLDEYDRPVLAGQQGEITATGLHNFAMPLIRYKTRDLAMVSDQQCECGRVHTVVEQLDGRMEDIVITPEGRHVGRLDQPFKYDAGISLAQITQDEVSSIVVRIVRNDQWRPGLLEELEGHLRDRLGVSIRITFEFVDDIEPGPNGKRRLVVSTVARNTAMLKAD